MVSPAPHLDGGYTIFGEVVSGMDVVMEINKLDKVKPGGAAFVDGAGCLKNCAPQTHVTPKCATRSRNTTGAGQTGEAVPRLSAERVLSE